MGGNLTKLRFDSITFCSNTMLKYIKKNMDWNHSVLDLTSGEALSAFQAVVFCVEIGGQDICLKSGAKQVVESINSLNDNWSQFGHITADIRLRLCTFPLWQCGYVNQIANSATHGLAKMTTAKCVIDRIWRDETAACICDIIIIEQLSLSI
jgi:hypothetical protein